MYQNYKQIVHLNKSSVCVSIFLIDEFLNSPSSLRSDVFILFLSLFILDLILLHVLCTSRRALKMTINDKSFHKKKNIVTGFPSNITLTSLRHEHYVSMAFLLP